METTKSDLAKIIRERRSVKTGYNNEPVPQELVKELLDDACWAPTHGLREPWRFIYIPEEEKEGFVESLVQTFPKDMQENRRNYFSQPTAFLIAVMEEDPRQKQWEENFGAISCLLQNFQLLAWERGLGVVWKTNPQIHEPKVRRLLGVEQGEKIVGFIHMGFFDHEPKTKTRTPIEQKWSVYKN
ncbi:nitroreductase [Halobacillus sp. ACCC02827]|uniref:nitroreductase family protein n=1 Tax=Bacillaceae TaxID=186817 RepID=UPI0002A51975|nr:MULTISPECIES: nitroreductase [Bacillaceae]ELK44534.1 nitroreductase family protein [Halobacillus sp. BAB-2008]QHT46784.1 nitroreductase [Bacillus sp. SB49]WJE17597.1 nitroreductase [Halobacillus sp. ACCC02827]